MMTVLCVRNTVIEDYHSRGSLSQADMKAFNQEVANNIYTFLDFMFRRPQDEWVALLKVASFHYPSEWDKPKIDRNMEKAARMIKAAPGG